MATVLDVAAHILTAQGTLTAMNLQKLCYYSQAWHLTWCETPLVTDPIQAWANGPVAPALYNAHRGEFTVSPGDIKGNAELLDDDAQDSSNRVLEFYGDMTAYQLSELTHREDPWKDARGGLDNGEPSDAEITYAAMAEYYGSL